MSCVMSNHWFVFPPVLLLTLWVAVVGSAAPGAAEQVGLEEGPQKMLTLTLNKASQLSPAIILMSGGVHEGGMLQSELFTSRSQNLVLGKLRSSGFWRYS